MARMTRLSRLYMQATDGELLPPAGIRCIKCGCEFVPSGADDDGWPLFDLDEWDLHRLEHAME